MKNIEKELKRVGVNEIAVNTYKGTPDDYVKLPEDAVFLAEAGFIDQASLTDFTADDFDWDAYYTAYGEFLSALGGRDWSTVIPVTLYAGWEKVDPQLSPP